MEKRMIKVWGLTLVFIIVCAVVGTVVYGDIPVLAAVVMGAISYLSANSIIPE